MCSVVVESVSVSSLWVDQKRSLSVELDPLPDYGQPPLDEAIREELQAYVIRRRADLGD